jgi:hypothetical protein
VKNFEDKDIEIRESFAGWSKSYGSEVQQNLYSKWNEFNKLYFEDSKMVQPIIELDTPTNPRRLGQFSPRDISGITGKILIRPSLLKRYYGSLENCKASRMAFIEDVLLHEMIHQHCHEILGRPEFSYNGHGPVFKSECNRIGAIMGLSPVRDCKARGSDSHLPSCSYWPHCVRISDFEAPKRAKPKYSQIRVPIEFESEMIAYLAELQSNA